MASMHGPWNGYPSHFNGTPWYQPTQPWIVPAPAFQPAMPEAPKPAPPSIVTITIPDPRVDELKKKVEELEKKLAKLLPGELQFNDPPPEGTEGRVVEL